MNPRQRNHAREALTRVEVLVVVAGIAGLVTLLVPALARAKAKAQRIRCTSYSAQIAMSFRMWANDHGEQYPMALSSLAPATNAGTLEFVALGQASPHFQILSNELNDPLIPT